MAFLEVEKFGIEMYESCDPGVSVERTDGRGILFEILVRIRACFSGEREFHLLHTGATKVECAFHAYLHHLGVH